MSVMVLKDVRLTRITRDTKPKRRPDGEWYGDYARVRTKAGTRALNLLGECQAAGGTVSMTSRYCENGDEWMDAELTWPGG